MVQKVSVILSGKKISATLNLLSLVRDHASLSIDGIGRVEQGSEDIFLRVDQTNILLGENVKVRGRPVLEIETDSIE
jgi:Fe-S cluster assembly scaffold protein SufB